jgi:HAE1 family hydrophobic/amphiphilic exporter-1
MNLSEPFIRRPVMTAVLTVSVVLFGTLSYRQLPVNDLPAVDYPVIQVEVDYPGANPDTVANDIATPLERQFMQIAGLELVTSKSSQGHVSLTLQFALDKSIDAAATDVQTAISQATGSLPIDLPSPPTPSKTNPNDLPIIYIALTSDSITAGRLYDYASTQVGQRISILPGVSRVAIFGAKSAIRIKADPAAMWARAISIDDLAAAIRGGTSYSGAGQLDSAAGTALIRPHGQLESVEAYRNLIVSTSGGAPIYLRDVAEVRESPQDERIAQKFWARGYSVPSATVVAAVYRQAGANAVKVAKSIRDIIPVVTAELPGSVRITPIHDNSQTIVNSVHDVKRTLALAFVLVVIVIFVFLGRVADTLIPAFGAADLAAPHVRGDVASRVQPGQPVPHGADPGGRVPRGRCHRVPGEHGSADGARRVGARGDAQQCPGDQLHHLRDDRLAGGRFPATRRHARPGGTHLPGVRHHDHGRDPRLGAGLADPHALMCARLLGERGRDAHRTWMERVMGGIERRVLAGYGPTLGWFLRRRAVAAAIWGVCLLGTVGFFLVIPKAFLPAGDSSVIFGGFIAREGSSPQQMQRLQDRADEVLHSDPSLITAFTMTGNAAFVSSNEGFMFTVLRRPEERGPIDLVAGQLMDKLGAVPGMLAFLRPAPVPEISTGATNQNQGQYAFSVFGRQRRPGLRGGRNAHGEAGRVSGVRHGVVRLLQQHAEPRR